MTILQKSVRRETAASIRDGGKLLPIIIEIFPGYLTLRQKGRRRRLTLDYGAAYMVAARALADDRRREKMQARKAKARS